MSICEQHKGLKICPIGCEYVLSTCQLIIPPWTICPITHEMYKNPIIDYFGHSYDCDAFIKWSQMKPGVSPLNIPYPENYRNMQVFNFRLREAVQDVWRDMLQGSHNNTSSIQMKAPMSTPVKVRNKRFKLLYSGKP